MSLIRLLNQILIKKRSLRGLHIKCRNLIQQYSRNYKSIIIQLDLMEPQNNGDQNYNEEQIMSPNYNQMTEAERQADFRRKHQQYIAIKNARKKQLVNLIKEQFGSSSSESEGENEANSDSSNERKSKQIMQQTTKVTPQNVFPAKSEGNKNLQELVIPITIKKTGQWVKEPMTWKQNNILMVDNYGYEIKTISKLKILSQPVVGCNFKIKMSYHQSEVIFGVPEGLEKDSMPMSYFIFAKIIKERLGVAGFYLKPRVAVENIPGLPDTLIKSSYIYGKIFKKSQVLGKWEERFVVINKQGILSYRSFNEKYSMKINAYSIRELWTRFDVHEELLVIKIWHNSKKTQFGFPLFQCVNDNNWLYYFFKMMVKGK